MRKKLLIFGIYLLLMAFNTVKATCGENRKPSEYEVKAAYIYNFAKFVEWPNSRSQTVNRVIHVCVLGDDPFGPSLSAIAGKTAGDRTIEILRPVSVHNIRDCEVIFISNSEEEHVAQMVKTLNNVPALTIGDTEGFAQQGVMINFYFDNKTVRFEINPKAARRAGLRISSNLLRIAKIVGEQ